MRSTILSVGVFLLACAYLTVSAGEAAKLEMSADEKRVLDLTNAERKKKDLPPLRANALLFKAARAHSANMAKKRKLEHDLDGKTSFDRIKDAGYEAAGGAENIGLGEDGITVAEVFQGWMKSKSHRDNILERRFTEIGLGLAKAKNGTIYYTQVFAAPLKE